MPKTYLPMLTWDQNFAPDIQSVEPLGEGDFCVCYLINGTHVVRLAKYGEASAAMRRELLLLPRLAGHLGIQIPLPEGSGIQADTGEQFICYPLVRGTILETEVLSSLTLNCQAELARQLAEVVRRLHNFPVETAMACGLRETNPRHYLPELLHRASIALAQQLDASVWRYCRRLFDLYFKTPELHTYAPALLHGDLSPGHFLADLERCALTGVIDFGDSLIGDPHWDLIFLLEDYGEEFFKLFLTFYSPAMAQQVSRRVQIFQQLNNVEYCLSQLAVGDQMELAEAIHTLVTQATIQAIE